MHTDMQGKTIDIGDIVIYSTSSPNGRAPALTIGEVLEIRTKSIKVQPLDAHLNRIKQRDGFYRGTGQFYNWGNPPREIQEFVQTGEKDATPVSIQSVRPERFYIIRKI